MQTLRSAATSSRAATVRPSRSAVVVRASAESRRAVLSGFVAGAALIAAKNANAAATSVDLFDDRSAIDRGFDLIYEARDLSIPQNQRDGLTQARTDLTATKKRVKDSESRIDAQLDGLVSKAYWTKAREELRGQVGTLRFDLNTLASAKGDKTAKKQALALRSDFLSKVEALDLAIRKKDKDAAMAQLAASKTALDAVLAAVL